MNHYKEFIDYLYTFEDLKYKDFHKKLILQENLIGIRTPILKKIAKQIANSDYKNFFDKNELKLYEEKLLYGLVLGYIKLDFSDLIPLLNNFLLCIDNWAICDLTATNLKIFSKIDDNGIKEIKKYLKHDSYWINRFGYVLLLNYYINKKYINEIFKLCNDYKDEYYVKMSIAWLISICYIKFKKETLEFLKNNNLDNWTYNKSLQKIIESKRINNIEKNMLRSMKRK